MKDATGDEFDPPPPRPTGRCSTCNGHGMIQPAPGYLDRHFPFPAQLLLDASKDEHDWYALQTHGVEQKRRSAQESYYPCPDCVPERHALWLHRLTHRDDCDVCTPTVKKARR